MDKKSKMSLIIIAITLGLLVLVSAIGGISDALNGNASGDKTSKTAPTSRPNQIPKSLGSKDVVFNGIGERLRVAGYSVNTRDDDTGIYGVVFNRANNSVIDCAAYHFAVTSDGNISQIQIISMGNINSDEVNSQVIILLAAALPDYNSFISYKNAEVIYADIRKNGKATYDNVDYYYMNPKKDLAIYYFEPSTSTDLSANALSIDVSDHIHTWQEKITRWYADVDITAVWGLIDILESGNPHCTLSLSNGAASYDFESYFILNDARNTIQTIRLFSVVNDKLWKENEYPTHLLIAAMPSINAHVNGESGGSLVDCQPQIGQKL